MFARSSVTRVGKSVSAYCVYFERSVSARYVERTVTSSGASLGFNFVYK